jgi:hypothetical protein
MGYMSAADPGFLATLESWLRSQPEILVLIRYSRAAGAKDFEFASCREAIPDGAEFVVLERARSTAAGSSWFQWTAGDSHEELRNALADLRGVEVAAGPFPPWLRDNDDVVSAVVPNEDGSVTTGVY